VGESRSLAFLSGLKSGLVRLIVSCVLTGKLFSWIVIYEDVLVLLFQFFLQVNGMQGVPDNGTGNGAPASHGNRVLYCYIS